MFGLIVSLGRMQLLGKRIKKEVTTRSVTFNCSGNKGKKKYRAETQQFGSTE